MMPTYLKTIFLTAVAIAAATALSPPSPKLQKAVQGITAAILLVVLLSPLGGLSFSFSPEGEFGTGGEVYAEAWEKGVTEGMRRDLSERFSLSDFSLSVTLTEDRTPSHVRITFPARDPLLDAVGIHNYITEEYQTTCEVVFEE